MNDDQSDTMIAADIARDQADLMVEWASRYRESESAFGRDGILDPALWLRAPVRVLFLLKETNSFTGELHDKYSGNLCSYFSIDPWKRLGHWAHGIQNTTITSIPTLSDADKDFGSALRSSAVANLKKLAGGATAVAGELSAAVERDRDLLDRQFALGLPQVIVCGATLRYLTDSILAGDSVRQVGPDGRCWVRESTLWVDYHHPSAPYGDHMMYYGLMMLYQNAIRDLREF